MKAQLFKSTVKIALVMVSVAAVTQTADASIFGKSKKKKAQEAAAAAQLQYDRDQARLVYERQLEQQRQAELLRQQDERRNQQQFAQPTTPAQTFAQPVSQPNSAANDGTPIDPKTGKPMTKDQLRLKEFRDQPTFNQPIIITQPEWTQAVEAEYSRFVSFFGRGVRQSPQRTMKSYMRDPKVNMYANTDPESIVYYTDCADLPYFLRSYFAFKNGLPMSIAADVYMSQQPYASLADKEDKRVAPTTNSKNSPYGNIIGRRAGSNIPAAPGKEINYLTYWGRLMDQGSTVTFRVGPLSPNYDLSDIYPVRIDLNDIKAGTIVHSNGHVLVVTEVLNDGTIDAIDAHPDNSIQFKNINPSNLERSRPDHGFGFFNFRPTKAVGGNWKTSPNGQQALYGAKIVTASDAELYNQGKWSMEQWFGPGSNIAPQSRPNPNAWRSAFKDVGFFDYVRTALSTSAATKSDEASGQLLTEMCNNLTQRVPDVAAAIEAGVTALPRPAALPANVYTDDGNWGAFATPSRDGRTRESMANLSKDIVQKFRAGVRNELKLTYSGSAQQYQQEMLNRLAVVDASCRVTYKKSNGSSQTLNLTDLIRRGSRLSFDMSDCAEKRWGASGDELASCRDQDPSNAWYNAMQSMRNTTAKTDGNENYILRSDRPITLDMLRSGRFVDIPAPSPINLGFSRSSIVDLKAYLASPQFIQDLTR